ncbi:MAG: hypothetical protein FWB99_12205 [Treponema sp.]|nr:hypothetical protein [Treponema sp.]
MTKNTDWWPSTRTGQLEMAKKWVEVLAEHGNSWNILKDIMRNFEDLVQAAENALHDVQNENANTTVAKTKCGEVFDQMTAAARDIKRWFFHSPPLKDYELVMLGLKPRDRKATPSGTPTAQAIAETFLKGVAQMGVNVVYRTGSHDDPANKVFRVYYVVRTQGEKAPQSPGEFTHSFPAKRRESTIQFDFTDSGKVCYLIVQIENGKKKGPWGPISSALIP